MTIKAYGIRYALHSSMKRNLSYLTDNSSPAVHSCLMGKQCVSAAGGLFDFMEDRMESNCECACCGQVTTVDSAYQLCAACYAKHEEQIEENRRIDDSIAEAYRRAGPDA